MKRFFDIHVIDQGSYFVELDLPKDETDNLTIVMEAVHMDYMDDSDVPYIDNITEISKSEYNKATR